MPSIHKNASEKEAVGFSSASEWLRGLCWFCQITNDLVIFTVSFYPKLKIPQVIYCQISSP